MACVLFCGSNVDGIALPQSGRVVTLFHRWLERCWWLSGLTALCCIAWTTLHAVVHVCVCALVRAVLHVQCACVHACVTGHTQCVLAASHMLIVATEACATLTRIIALAVKVPCAK